MILIDMNGNRYEVTRVMARNIDLASERWHRNFDAPDEQGDVIYQSEVYVLKAVETKEEEQI